MVYRPLLAWQYAFDTQSLLVIFLGFISIVECNVS